MKKYICPIENYLNCRVHEGGYFSTLEFFENKEELMAWALTHIQDDEIVGIYNLEGEICGKIMYELGGHHCIGIKLEIESQIYQVKDDGSGNKRWVLL